MSDHAEHESGLGTRPLAKVLIADDEEAPRAQLVAALACAWPEARLVAACVNGVDAWDAFLEHEPEVCLLDIRMPGLSGIEVAQRINGRARVVFVTAHTDHALAAFDAGAVDYVLKPVEATRLAQALTRVQAGLRPRAAEASATLAKPIGPAPAAHSGGPSADADAHHTQGAASVAGAVTGPATLQALLAELAAQIRRPAPLQVIQAGVGKEVRLIRVEEVVYFEADSRYTRVVYDGPAGGGDALIRTPLKELLAQLDETLFWQVHRSVIVNQRHIAAAVRVDEGQMHLVLRNRRETLPVSRHFQGLFKGQ